MKKKVGIVFIYLMAALILSLGNVYAVTYLYGANEVSYSNTSSGLSANNVQDALDQLYAASNNYEKLNKMIYPVGSIYMSVTDDTVSKVQQRFGGTWEKFGTGKTLIGVNESNTSYDESLKTGGSSTVTLETTNLPSHAHTVTAKGTVTSTFTGSSVNTGSGGAHTHSISAFNSGSAGAHTHTAPNTNSGSAGAHTHSTSGSCTSAGNHSHNLQINSKNVVYCAIFKAGTNRGGFNYNETPMSGYSIFLSSGGAHTHSIAAVNSGSAGGHSHTKSTTTSSAGAHSHTKTTSSGNGGGSSHTVTATGTIASTFTGTSTNTESTGSGTSFSILQPYVTVYMYKRTS